MLAFTLDGVVPPNPPPPPETAWCKRLLVPSPRLSAFWGRPVELEAQILLPAGFDERPAARYPVVLQVGPGINPIVTLEKQLLNMIGNLV